MRDDDGRAPGDEGAGRVPDEIDGGPVGAPVLPAWMGERPARVRGAVRRLLPTRGARVAAAAYLGLTLFHLVLAVPYVRVASAFPQESGLSLDPLRITQTAMMPLLALALFLATPPHSLPGKPAGRPRLVLLVLAALGLSWAGDTAPGFVPAEFSFLAMIGFFLLAQVVYVAAFLPFAGESPVRRPGVVAVYAVVGVAVVGACTPALIGAGVPGWLTLVGLVVYSALLCAMALLARGVHRLAGIGGIVFVVSDGLIALTSFTPVALWQPLAGWWGVLIMSTYAAAQLLIVAGVLRRTLR